MDRQTDGQTPFCLYIVDIEIPQEVNSENSCLLTKTVIPHVLLADGLINAHLYN